MVPRAPGGQPPHVRALPINYSSDAEESEGYVSTSEAWSEQPLAENRDVFLSSETTPKPTHPTKSQETSLFVQDQEEEDDIDLFGLDTSTKSKEPAARLDMHMSSSFWYTAWANI